MLQQAHLDWLHTGHLLSPLPDATQRMIRHLLESLVVWMFTNADDIHDVYGDDFSPCPARHPEHLLLCGNWAYARKHELYPAGHEMPHVMGGRVPHANGLGYVNISARWES